MRPTRRLEEGETGGGEHFARALRWNNEGPIRNCFQEFEVSRAPSSGSSYAFQDDGKEGGPFRVCPTRRSSLGSYTISSLGRRIKCRGQKRTARKATCRSTITAVISRSVISIRCEYRVYFSRPTRDHRLLLWSVALLLRRSDVDSTARKRRKYIASARCSENSRFCAGERERGKEKRTVVRWSTSSIDFSKSRTIGSAE